MRFDSGTLSVAEVGRRFDKVAAGFDNADYVHRATCDGLIERLVPVEIDPAVILDLGSATGRSSRQLGKQYRRATIVGVDASIEMLKASAVRGSFLSRRRFGSIQADALGLPFRNESADLVFCNMMLPWVEELPACFSEVARVLRKNGVFAFATLGPDSLAGLRDLLAPAVEMHSFPDMHVVGDALVSAGLADPVLDVDRLRVTFPSSAELLADLAASGASNSVGAATLDEIGETGGQLSLELELVYGHAWGRGPLPEAGEYHLDPASIGHYRRS